MAVFLFILISLIWGSTWAAIKLGLEGVPTEPARASKIARGALYHYDPNPAREYCLPTCGDIARRPISLLFTRRAQAEARGLVPCTTCHPDLHPLPE